MFIASLYLYTLSVFINDKLIITHEPVTDDRCASQAKKEWITFYKINKGKKIKDKMVTVCEQGKSPNIVRLFISPFVSNEDVITGW